MTEEIRIREAATARNDEVAAVLRREYGRRKLLVFNMIGSPGCGKTMLLEKLGKSFGRRLGVITGDLRTTLDAERIASSGAAAVQIETGEACHLTAMQVEEALRVLDLEGPGILVIENVGNLVCPASFDLGEAEKIAILSVAEGDEKPVKYPSLFTRAGLVVLTKTDLLPHVRFSMERVQGDIKTLNAAARIFATSCFDGSGMEALRSYLASRAGIPVL